MTPSFSVALCFTLVLSAIGAFGEKHTIEFDNQCGHGTPRLIQRGNILSTGEPFTFNGPFVAGIAYLQTGSCLLNGEGCTLVEMSLINPSCPGCGSSTDISLIPPLKYSIPATFSYFGGCDGQGTTCSSPNCKTAFFVPDDNHVQVQCQDNDVNLLITFCGGGGGAGAAAIPKVDSSSANTTKPALTSPSPTTHRAIVAAAESTTVSATSTPVSNAPHCSRKRSERRGLAGSSRPTRRSSDLHRRSARRWH